MPLFDESLDCSEQLPRVFSISFEEVESYGFQSVRVSLDGSQVGDVVDDNAYQNDNYRYHDVFHYSFATLLGWSPCARTMLKRKRKSNKLIDKIEDGARAAITEEAISLIIFTEAKNRNYFLNENSVDSNILKFIKNITENFEVKRITSEEWENAILKSYEIFRLLVSNKGGIVLFNMNNKSIKYQSII